MTAPYRAHSWVDNELITAPRLNAIEEALSGVGSATMPRALLMYYGIPQQINGKNDSTHAAQILASYDDVVLGAGLAKSSDPNHTTTVSIIATAKAMNPDLTIWGYVDLGVTTSNYSLTTLGSTFNDWAAAGAQGIFLDHAGTDYGVNRTRLNSALDSLHGLGLVGLINASNQADLATNAAPLNVTSYDACLLESMLVNSDSANPAGVDTMTNFKNRVDSARANRDVTGLRILSSAIIGQSSSAATITNWRQLNEAACLITGLDGFGFGASRYSASGSMDVNVAPAAVRYWPTNGYAKEATYTLNGAVTELARADLGLTLHVESSNNYVTDAGFFPARTADVLAQAAGTGDPAATPNTVVRRDGTGATALTGVTGLTDVTGKSNDVAANKGYVDTKVAIAGDLGGTPAAPTVTGGTHHTHTSAQVSDATSAATANMVVKRDANGRAQVATPSAAGDIATKGYVDGARPVMYVQNTDPASGGTVTNGSIWFQTS